MDIKQLFELVGKAQTKDALQAGCTTLGAVLDALRLFPADAPCVFDVGGSPFDPHSYRGYYERLALEACERPTTAGAVADLLAECIGSTFEGYKGGAYRMGRGTLLHQATYGYTGRMITGVMRDEEGRAVITTAEDAW